MFQLQSHWVELPCVVTCRVQETECRHLQTFAPSSQLRQPARAQCTTSRAGWNGTPFWGEPVAVGAAVVFALRKHRAQSRLIRYHARVVSPIRVAGVAINSTEAVALNRCLVTLADQKAREEAAQRRLEPEVLADLLLDLGATGVELRWYGSLELLEQMLGGTIDLSWPPTFEQAQQLLHPSLDGTRPSLAAVDFFWRGLVCDVTWNGPGMCQAVPEAGIRLLGSATALDIAELSMEDKDWISAVREQCGPQLIGRIVVAHSQHDPSDVKKLIASQTPSPLLLTLEVGAGFGFGDHPTTRLCVNWLQHQDLSRLSVLDYGCGTGVLGLVAQLLGAREGVGVDCDLASLLLARMNATRNKMALELYTAVEANHLEWECVSFYNPSSSTRGDLVFPKGPPQDRHFDVVIANMTPSPLLRVAARISGALVEGGVLALSGLREEAVGEVTKAYAMQGIVLKQESADDGFVLLSGRKRS